MQKHTPWNKNKTTEKKNKKKTENYLGFKKEMWGKFVSHNKQTLGKDKAKKKIQNTKWGWWTKTKEKMEFRMGKQKPKIKTE